MATYDLPTALIPQVSSFGLQKAGVQFRSPFNGTLQSLDLAAERWACSLTSPAKSHANAGAAEAFLNVIAGGVNKVRIYHPARPVPYGTLRGSPTIGTAAAIGDSTLSLVGCATHNLILGGSFEVDANANGIGDGWSAYANGTTGTVTRSRDTGPYSGQLSSYVQQVSATGLGTTASDRMGITQEISVSGYGGMPFTFSTYLLGATTGLPMARLYIEFYNGGSFLSTSESTVAPNGSSFTRFSRSGTIPSTATRAVCYIWAEQRSGGVAGSSTLFIDGVQFELASSATTFASPATLLAGDMLGSSGQLFQVAENATANDAGAMTVTLVNRVRAAISSSTAVTWNKPTAEFVCPAMLNRSVFRPGLMEGAVLDLEEAF